MMSAWQSRSMERNDIRLSKKFIKRHIVKPQHFSKQAIALPLYLIKDQHVHAKTNGYTNNTQTDRARTNHTKRLAVKVKATQAFEGIVSNFSA